MLTNNSNFWLDKACFLRSGLTGISLFLSLFSFSQSRHGVQFKNLPAYRLYHNSQRVDQLIDSASTQTFIHLHAYIIDHQFNFTDITPQLKEGTEVYTYKIESNDNPARLYFKYKGGWPLRDSLFLYDIAGNTLEIFHRGNLFSENFVSEPYQGDIIIQLVSYSRVKAQLSLTSIALEKQPPASQKKSLDFGDSEFCEVNINCSEGNDYQDVKRAVARILIRVGNFAGWCSGTLVNNTAYDYRSYFLTAEHCGIIGSNFVSASDLQQWTFYFNYESPDCANPPSEGNLASQRMTGASLIANSDDNGGDFGSDFLLLELNNDVPDSFNPYYAGWNRSGEDTPEEGVAIHHPQGDIKKISTYNFPAANGSFGNTPNTHWLVQWSATANGHGVTEQGSSGSAVLDENNLIRGVLTGGQPTCSDPVGFDFFGKFSYSWAQNGNADNRRLKPWLDPLNEGSLAITGANKGDPKPVDTTGFSLKATYITSGTLSVNGIGNSTDRIRVQLFELSGKLVYDEITVALPGISEEINVSFLRNGMYVFRLLRNNRVTNTEKIVILNR